MIALIIKFLNILMAGLIAGTLFGIWIGYNPRSLSAVAYIEQQQGAIKALNTLMPLLGLITIIITLVAAFLQKQHNAIFLTLLIASAFLIISGLVTRFGNQPINSIVMGWDKMNTPGNWIEFRDKWWTLHKIRAVTALIAFCLIIISNLHTHGTK